MSQSFTLWSMLIVMLTMLIPALIFIWVSTIISKALRRLIRVWR